MAVPSWVAKSTVTAVCDGALSVAMKDKCAVLPVLPSATLAGARLIVGTGSPLSMIVPKPVSFAMLAPVALLNFTVKVSVAFMDEVAEDRHDDRLRRRAGGEGERPGLGRIIRQCGASDRRIPRCHRRSHVMPTVTVPVDAGRQRDDEYRIHKAGVALDDGDIADRQHVGVVVDDRALAGAVDES